VHRIEPRFVPQDIVAPIGVRLGDGLGIRSVGACIVAKQVEALINQGSLAEVWLPASGTKTVALVLERQAGTLPPATRARANSAIKRVIIDSWALDNYGDLGSRDKIDAAYSDLAGAIAELRTLYAVAP